MYLIENTKKTKTISFLSLVTCLTVGLFSCQTHSDPGTQAVPTGQIPITISGNTRIQTKATGTSFDANDKVGLFVLEQPNELTDLRHVDNICYTWDGSEWKPEQIIYYPSTESICDFYAYYPYQESALEEGSSVISCSVYPNQNVSENYMYSDFLVAEKVNVSPTEDAVPLIFKHKLVEIKIELLPGTAYDSAAELLAADPVVSLKSVATQADYDMKTAQFSDQSNLSDIDFAGAFTVEGNKLTGLRAIVVPQTIKGDHVLVEVTVEGRLFGFTFGTDYQMKPATQETYTLTMQKAAITEPGIPGVISATISDWENKSELEGELKEQEKDDNGDNDSKNGYTFTLPDFSESSVYVAMDGQTKVAEICREYLNATGINNQAIVVYPVNDGVTDLSSGHVVAILSEYAGTPLSGNIHGGSVVWNTYTNTLTYSQGNLPAKNEISINADGLLSEEVEDAFILSVQPELINDHDNIKYPIVKVATQYWMGENLKTKSLADGSFLTNATTGTTWKTEQSKTNPAALLYIENTETGALYYNLPVVQSAFIAPEGWSVPVTLDWNKLDSYISNQHSLIKDISWVGSNLTGLGIKNVGYYTPDALLVLSGTYFWDNTGGALTITQDNLTYDYNCKKYGFSIRCIRK